MQYANFIQENRRQNSTFDPLNYHLYNSNYTPIPIRNLLLEHGIELSTPDLNEGKAVIFNLFSDGQTGVPPQGINFLMAIENPYINPQNINLAYINKFRRVFTFNRNLVNLPNVTQIFLPNRIRIESFPQFDDRHLFACLINSNKTFPFSLKSDLYLERVKTIRWYEENHPLDFHLYGMGWDKPLRAYSFKNKVTRRIQRIGTQLFNYKPFPSYRGEIENKYQVFSKAKFAYCYENVNDLPDYITEKIFDCFFGGCVPIYWGSDTVNDHIPANCFINRSNFKNTSQVHKFLKTIDEDTYHAYQANIKKYLSSIEAKKFDIDYFSKTIVNAILSDLNFNIQN
jgi:hypothetical protein